MSLAERLQTDSDHLSITLSAGIPLCPYLPTIGSILAYYRVQAALAVWIAPLSSSAFGAAPPSHCFLITPTPRSKVNSTALMNFEISLVIFDPPRLTEA